MLDVADSLLLRVRSHQLVIRYDAQGIVERLDVVYL